jgi:ribonuclease-3
LALTHPSYARDHSLAHAHYERLEFLGDSVLSLVLAETLYTTYPNEPEGRLAAARSALSRGQELSQLAERLGLAPHLLIGKGTHDPEGNIRPSILENALEALIGAIFLDGGYLHARTCVLQWYAPLPVNISELLDDLNPKGKLQEYYQSRDNAPEIAYHLLEESGPDHAKSYRIEVRIAETAAGEGTGSSKKEAEENAAREALKKAKA